jgi:hypothetical protein
VDISAKSLCNGCTKIVQAAAAPHRYESGTHSTHSPGIDVSHFGTAPLNWLSASSSLATFDSFAQVAGMGPFNWLPLTSLHMHNSNTPAQQAMHQSAEPGTDTSCAQPCR